MVSGSEKDSQKQLESMTIFEFLESCPPNTWARIPKLIYGEKNSLGGFFPPYYLIKPQIQIYCPSDSCGGLRFFRCITGGDIPLSKDSEHFFLLYRCGNCQNSLKTFSLTAKLTDKSGVGEIYKFGELPVYGPPTPARLIKLIGPDRDIFLKGRRCENHGLGIGAFTYYRRVVENQKNRIIKEIIDVSKKIGAPKDKIATLEQALEENQFSKALELTKDVVPESLLVDGHNPLLLLHKALSKGVHELTDEMCLNLAGSVRVVLGELSDRLGQALKNEKELTDAVSVLLNCNRSS